MRDDRSLSHSVLLIVDLIVDIIVAIGISKAIYSRAGTFSWEAIRR
jgi:hypothetical protein